MIRNEQVARLWSKGKVGRSKNMSTDGKTLWSYGLPIGVTVGGKRVAFPAMAPNFISNTTSRHSSFAAQYADVVAPKAAVSQLVDAWNTWYNEPSDLQKLARKLAEDVLGGKYGGSAA